MNARPAALVLISLACATGACLGSRVPARSARSWTFAHAPVSVPDAALCSGGTTADDDHDGLADDCEDALAQRFAPIVIHSTDESNFPTNVDSFLRGTSLVFRDDTCGAAQSIVVARAPTESDLLRGALTSPCGGTEVESGGSRSRGKHRTFFLTDVAADDRHGSEDSREWTTYVHAYPNTEGGVTLQYWRFYAYNDAFNDHGGDWEGVHVVLDAHGALSRVRFLQHADLMEVEPRDLQWEGSHVVVYSEGGGHASRPRGDGIAARGCVDDPCFVRLEDPASYVWQETWRGGRVGWPNGDVTEGGALVDIGEKSAPLHGQLFVRYSGLWGSPGVFFGTSGYWGPAYNETSMASDEFVTSWCQGMAGPLDQRRECWPADRQP